MTKLVCIHPEPYDEALVANICDRFGVSALLARALIRRGLWDAEAIDAFLHPEAQRLSDPFLLPDMNSAVARIHNAIRMRERICVYGDYDADGVCATAILLRYLKTKTDNVRSYIPSRHDEGYGMNPESVRALADDGVQLILTVDNGISAIEEIRLCSALSMDVIVTDHHRPGAILPDCCAVVSAMRPDSEYPDANLCGAGVAMQLVRALSSEDVDSDTLAFAAIATIADVVPLLGENRVIAAIGLPAALAQKGISALLRAAGLTENRLSSASAAFAIAPRLNAAGRMGDANLALELLLTEDDARCLSLADRLNAANQQRRSEESRVLSEADAMIRRESLFRCGAILVSGSGWNKGVLGIVAARITEQYHRPAIVFAEDGDGILHGSGRSIDGIDLFSVLSVFHDRFLRFGGHSGAAGVSMAASKFLSFRTELDAYIRDTYPPEAFEQKVQYEESVALAQLDRRSVSELSLLAPFGEGNPEPIYRIEDVQLCSGRRIGSDGRHVSAELTQYGASMRMVAFGFGDALERIADAVPKDALCTVSIHSFLGRESVELIARKICAHDIHILKFYDAISDGILYNIDRVSIWAALQPYLEQMPDTVLRQDDSADAMRAEYRTLRRILSETDLPIHLAADRFSLERFLAMLVFWELGFFAPDGSGIVLHPVIGCAAQPLDASRLYRHLTKKKCVVN